MRLHRETVSAFLVGLGVVNILAGVIALAIAPRGDGVLYFNIGFMDLGIAWLIKHMVIRKEE